MNYEEMSDFEINSAVAAIVTGGDVIEKHDMAKAPTESGVQVIYKVGVHGEFLDYCNNPSDAWPIIVDNGISIIKDEQDNDEDWRSMSGVNLYYDWEGNESIDRCSADSYSKNPLRAAMICFLKMQDQLNK